MWRAYGLFGKLSTFNLTEISGQNGHLIKFPRQISFQNVLQFNLESKTEFILQLPSNTNDRLCGRIAEILVSYYRCRICIYKDHKS